MEIIYYDGANASAGDRRENVFDIAVSQGMNEHGENTPMTDTIKIVSFAGLDVPEDGLKVYPPQGGELTVFPDGGYAFTPAAGNDEVAGEPPVTTYYSFLMEDIDGEISTGTFALSPREEMPAEMGDFHAWSLPELLHDEGGATRLLLGGDEAHGGPAALDTAVVDAHLEFSGLGSFDDDLVQLIITSQQS